MKFIADCPSCGKRVKAETRFVLNQLIDAHARACADKEARRELMRELARNQGSLF